MAFPVVSFLLAFPPISYMHSSSPSFDSIVDKIELQAIEIRVPEIIIKCSYKKNRRT
jgi:hypothetical protein